MADKNTLVAQLKQIVHQKGKEISEAEAQARVGDRFYAEAFGYGTEIKPDEQRRLSEIAGRVAEFYLALCAPPARASQISPCTFRSPPSSERTPDKKMELGSTLRANSSQALHAL
jgi:hypothetical protein